MSRWYPDIVDSPGNGSPALQDACLDRLSHHPQDMATEEDLPHSARRTETDRLRTLQWYGLWALRVKIKGPRVQAPARRGTPYAS